MAVISTNNYLLRELGSSWLVKELFGKNLPKFIFTVTEYVKFSHCLLTISFRWKFHGKIPLPQ